MDLIWLDSNAFRKPDELPDELWQSEHGVQRIDDYDPETSKLRIKFEHFGRGEKRSPSFAVQVEWLDVKNFIREYIEMGHPEAVHLKEMIELADAIERAGWSPRNPPPEEFSDILPP